jgi:hypothetical protein
MVHKSVPVFGAIAILMKHKTSAQFWRCVKNLLQGLEAHVQLAVGPSKKEKRYFPALQPLDRLENFLLGVAPTLTAASSFSPSLTGLVEPLNQHHKLKAT